MAANLIRPYRAPQPSQSLSGATSRLGNNPSNQGRNFRAAPGMNSKGMGAPAMRGVGGMRGPRQGLAEAPEALLLAVLHRVWQRTQVLKHLAHVPGCRRGLRSPGSG